jgi:TldD protein
VQHSALYTSIDPLQSMSREEKLDILRRVDKVAARRINACRKFQPA